MPLEGAEGSRRKGEGVGEGRDREAEGSGKGSGREERTDGRADGRKKKEEGNLLFKNGKYKRAGKKYDKVSLVLKWL